MTHVLIVDDEAESRRRLKALLTEHGHAVSEASNGLDALEVARQQPPDLVISDILMPQMDGFALCRAYRTDPRLAHAPFVFYTDSYATAKDAAFARRLGATRFLVKSMGAEEVIRAITDAMREERTSIDGPESLPHETESYRLYNESLIQRLEHRNLELADEVRTLRDSESKLRALMRALDQLPSIVSLADTHGRIEYVNQRFQDATGFTREQVLGQTHSVLRAKHSDAGQGFEIRAMLLNGQQWRGEVEHRRRDGSSYWERATISPIYDDAGAVSHFLRIAEDITEAKVGHAEREADDQSRQRTDHVESVGRLAGGVAHDFNNLLTVIVGHTHLLMQQLPPQDSLRDDLAAVLDAAQRGTTITRQLLTYARRDVVHPLVVDPAQAIAALARQLQRQAGDEIRIGFSLGPGIWPVLIDPLPFDQMVVNLVANARDAIRGSGAIDLSLTNTSLTAAAAAAHGGLKAGEYVALRVSDTGGGIVADVLPRIFEPFFTTKGPGAGTGLGLSSVLGAVEQAGGRVEVERTGPDGTTFLVLLPRSAARPSNGPRPSATRSLEGHERILLVEDEPAVLELVRRTLEGYGYVVLHASTPERALRAIHEGGGAVDILVTDVVMPGMSGRDLAAQLRAMVPNLRVLFMSGYSSDVAADHGLVPADVSLIAKPFSPTALAAWVRAVLDGQSPGDYL